MPDLDALVETTDANADKPQSASIDGNSVTQHSIPDRIALEKHRAANIQSQSSGRLVFNKISPPGAD
jgi:hypothetical protein